MRHHALSLIACTLAAFSAAGASEPMVVFGVSPSVIVDKWESGRAVIEPIVLVQRTRRPDGTYRVVYKEPPAGFDAPVADPLTNDFDARYFKRGRAFTVVNGGAAVGYLRVKERTKTACVSLAALVDLHVDRPLVEEPDPTALAVASLPAKAGDPTRRWVTEAEYEEVTSLTRRVFERNGVPRTQLSNLEPYVAAFDLQRDGAGDYGITAETCARGECDELFLIATRTNNGLRAEVVRYRHTPQTDDHGESRRFVDHFDFDADGSDEIVTNVHSGEGTFSEIWRREGGGKWSRVYRGGGSGC